MSVRNIVRSAVVRGFATDTSAPIYVNSGTGKLRFIGGGAGSTTEQEIASNEQTSVTANLTVSAAVHGNLNNFVLNQATGGVTITLPAASGSGAYYQFFIGTALSSGNYIIKVANANDYMRGVAWTTQDAGDTALSFDTADTGTPSTESDTITLNGGSTGGVVGTLVTVRDIAANVWFVELQNKATGSEATPFSAAV